MRHSTEWKQVGKYDVDEESLLNGTSFEGIESMTIQSAAIDADINVLVRRFGLTGEYPVRRQRAEYGEFDESMDLRTILENMRTGEAMFATLPAELRAGFGNDPGTFVEWINDEANYDEAAEMGLVPKRDNPVPPVVSEASGTAPAAPAAPAESGGK